MSVLADVLAPDLDIVFCGTAPGTVSARRGAYYAGPGNAFWGALAAVGLTPHVLAAEDFGRVLEFGLGLTDLAKYASGADATLATADFDAAGLVGKIARYRPRILAFTSKRAAREFLGVGVAYGLQDTHVGATRLFVLPSPSGAARRYWDLEPWHTLARLRGRRGRA